MLGQGTHIIGGGAAQGTIFFDDQCLLGFIFFIMQAIDSRDRHDVLRRQQPTMEPTMCNCDPGPPGSPGRRGKRGQH